MFADLQGKRAIVTGGAGGIGSATVRSLVQAGVSVVIWDLNGPAASALAAELKNDHSATCAAQVDVADAKQVGQAVAQAERDLGGLDLLVNVAGGNAGTRPSLIDDMPTEDWQTVIGLNLSAPFHCIKACIEPMSRSGGGAVVTVASLASIRMSMNLGASYTSAKAGLLGLTRHAAFDLAPHKIRVNAVLPGPVLTEALRQHAGDSEILTLVPRQLPIGRWLVPQDIANAILFFCSDVSSACTGTHVVVDGGMHIGNPTTTDIYFSQRRTSKA